MSQPGHYLWPSGQMPFGAPAPPPMSVGTIADAIYQLSGQDRDRLYAILNVVPKAGTSGAAGAAPAGYTSRPEDGRIFKLTARKEQSDGYKAVLAAQKAASDALQAFVSSKNWKIVGAETRHNEDGTTAVVSPMKVTNQAGAVQQGAELSQLLEAQRASRAAEKQYRQDHPDEFKAPRPRGAPRGRGASTRGSRAGPRPGQEG